MRRIGRLGRVDLGAVEKFGHSKFLNSEISQAELRLERFLIENNAKHDLAVESWRFKILCRRGIKRRINLTFHPLPRARTRGVQGNAMETRQRGLHPSHQLTSTPNVFQKIS